MIPTLNEMTAHARIEQILREAEQARLAVLARRTARRLGRRGQRDGSDR
jgi:hypothetical protein